MHYSEKSNLNNTEYVVDCNDIFVLS